MRFNAQGLAAALTALPSSQCYWVGYSGGADSTALLTALFELKESLNINIMALHVNHGLHPASNQWQDHCERYCKSLGIHLETRRISPEPQSGEGLEAEARRLRYRIVAELLGSNEIFLTAHHLNDQAETLLLNLMRGSGVDGLAGMPKNRSLGNGQLARPLLEFRMESLKEYLVERGINWIEDPSNANMDYDRNFIRHELITAIEKRWPGANEQLANSAVLCREASTVLGKWAQNKLESSLPHLQVLDLSHINGRDEEFRMLIRQWLRMNRAPSLPGKRLVELCEQSAHASSQSRLSIEWQGWEIRQYRHCLWLQEPNHPTPLIDNSWKEPTRLRLGTNSGTIEFTGSGKLPRAELTVRARSGGDSLLMPGPCRRKVKDLLRESGFPPWLRAFVPVVAAGDEVLAVGDLFLSVQLQDWQASEHTRLIWQPELPLLRFCRDRFHAGAVDPETALR